MHKYAYLKFKLQIAFSDMVLDSFSLFLKTSKFDHTKLPIFDSFYKTGYFMWFSLIYQFGEESVPDLDT